MGLTKQGRGSRWPRGGKQHASPADELDALITYGHTALTAPGAAPLALQLDAALRLAGLHLRRAANPEVAAEHLQWAVTLASFVADRCADTTPAAVVELSSRAAAILDICASRLAADEATKVRAVAENARERLERAEELCAVSLEDAVTSLTIGTALLEHAELLPPAARPAVIGRAHALLVGATVAARRAGHAGLAEAAIAAQQHASTSPAGAAARPPRARHRPWFLRTGKAR